MSEVVLRVSPCELHCVRRDVDAVDTEVRYGAGEQRVEEERDAARACAQVEDGEGLVGGRVDGLKGVGGKEMC